MVERPHQGYYRNLKGYLLYHIDKQLHGDDGEVYVYHVYQDPSSEGIGVRYLDQRAN